jgi:hypothetical protein
MFQLHTVIFRPYNKHLCEWLINEHLGILGVLDSLIIHVINISSASEKIPCIVCNFKVHCHIHRNPPFVPVLRQMNQFDAIWSLFFEVNLNVILFSLLWSSKESPSFRFPHQHPVWHFIFPHVFCNPWQSHWPWCVDCKIICQGVQFIKPMDTWAWWS